MRNWPISSKKFTSWQEFDQWSKIKHNIVRELNTEIISNNFYFTNDAYSPHFVVLEDGEIYLISSKDNSVSIIDVKTARMSWKSRERLHKALKDSQYNDNDLSQKIDDMTKTIVFQEQQDKISLHAYPSYSQGSYDANASYDEKLQRYQSMKITEKLYNMTKHHQNFREIDGKQHTLDLTPQWKYFFAYIILEKFLSHNKSTNFLGRDWMTYLFPNTIFESLRSNLEHKRYIELEELTTFVQYLLQKEEKPSHETKLQMRNRHKRQKMRSHVINMLYSMIYTEGRYSHTKINQLSAWFSDNLKTTESWIVRHLGIDENDIYTEWWIKSLFSLSIKELRGEFATDLMRWKSWISSDLLQDANQKNNIIVSILSQQKDAIQQFYFERWYRVVIEEFEVANKYLKDKALVNRGIYFDKGDESSIKLLVESWSSRQTSHQANAQPKLRELYSYDISWIHIEGLDEEAKSMLQFALDQDDTKTWWNGNYADIKFRMRFYLEHMSNPEDVIKNLSYEYQIVDMDSDNEWWLSDHNIFLGPLKTIQAKLKISSAIDVDIFVDSVSWGIDKTIWDLTLLQYYRDHPQERPENMPLQFVEKQFSIRNQIPREILTLAWLQQDLTYLEIDKHPEQKEKIELAVAKYLLQDQLSKWRLHWFIYDNDNASLLDISLRKNILNGEVSSFYHSFQQDFIDEVLKEHHRKKGIYCLCGGWSNNLSKLNNNKSISGRWYIWIWDFRQKNNLSKQKILFMSSTAFGWIVSLWTQALQRELLLWKVNDQFEVVKGDSA